MSDLFKRYFAALLWFSSALELLALALYFFLPGEYVTDALPFLALLFFFASLAANAFLLKTGQKVAKTFFNRFMLSTFLRFFLYIVVIIAYVFINRSDAVAFLITFLLFFLAYLLFEAITLIRIMKPAEE